MTSNVRPADLGSRAALERARIELAKASHALGHWHAGDPPCRAASRTYVACGHDSIAAMDAGLRALHEARAALISEIRADQDARMVRTEALLNRLADERADRKE